MNQTARSLLAGLLLLLVASGLGRVSQLLAPHLPWPLLVLFVGGWLGTAAALVWQQRWIESWSAMLVWCLCSAIVLAAAEHYFAWQHQIAALETAWLKNIREQPQLGTFPSPFEPPTWSEFMSGGVEPWRTWAWWVFDASAKGLVALLVLILRRRSPLFNVPPIETAT